MKLFANKEVAGILLLGVVMILGFQNCGQKEFVPSEQATGNASLGSKSSSKCFFNGSELVEGASVLAFLNSNGTCVSETRTCRDGNLSGSYAYASCQSSAPAACLFNGITVVDGQSTTAYLNANPAVGVACQSESRRCTNGVLSGSFGASTCQENSTAATCQFNGRTLAHGESVLAFLSSTTAAGQACSQQTRICNNGALSGSYAFASCTPGTYASCSFNGQTIAHGQFVQAFAVSTVAYGQSCGSGETRVCNNGVLSGSAAFASCGVSSPASCLFNGQNIAHGASVVGYTTSSVPAGQTCASEARVCSNGTLSGSAAYASCAPLGLISTNVTVNITCTIDAGRNQSLKVTLANGTTKTWDFGNKTPAPFAVVFASAPTLFQAYSGGTLSAHKYSNQTAHTLKFSSEDGGDNDYNDLVCNFAW